MRKQITTTEKIRRLLAKGDTPKEIAKKLGVATQYVYNVQYAERKKQGLGAIAKAPKAPKVGIGAPPKKRGRPAKPKAELASPSPDILAMPKQTPTWPVPTPTDAVALPTFFEPWWKRAARAVLRFFRGY